MKNGFVVFLINALLGFFGELYAACPVAEPIDSYRFCASFKSAAQCHCVSSSGLPQGMCADMNLLYKRMVGTFGSLQRACEHQHVTTTQECITDWNCYRLGGSTSDGKLCSGSGYACE